MGAKLSGPSGQGGQTIDQNSDINVTPFVDIMLVLLIIFMVSAPLATVSIKLDLPPPMPGVSDPAEPVYVTIQDTGAIYVVDRATSLPTLAADTCAALGGGADCREERIFVRAQPDVRYESLMQVMNTFQGAGFYKVGLLNEDIV